MKNKETPFLDFYKECIPDGMMPKSGLCSVFIDTKEYDTLVLFRPEVRDQEECFWAFDGEYRYDIWQYHNDKVITNCFSPLRQTIVLFCAAINGEL